jgi:GH25 family lysozyme M1 (1,4-beta-N-acetylmuramidase)
MLGVDLFQQYNLVTDWHLVRAAGVRHVYVKLTDGGGLASTHGDAYTAGARAAGCAVGGYHYMQAAPSPERQADVFAAELHRLRALDIAPALDLEESSIPPAVRVDYGRRFLLRLQSTLNMSKVALYSSASWFTALKPDTWGISGLVSWVAQYGPNDGTEHPINAYTGHVDAHQYTSTGHIPGITGAVDLDNILTDITEGATMAVDQTDLNNISQAALQAFISFRVAGPDGAPRNLWDSEYENFRHLAAANASLVALAAAVSALAAKSDITKDELTAIVNDAVSHHLQITGTVNVTGT